MGSVYKLPMPTFPGVIDGTALIVSIKIMKHIKVLIVFNLGF